MSNMVDRLHQRLVFQRFLMTHMDPDSLVWYAMAQQRQRTLEDYFALLPDERHIYGIEPKTVISIL